RYQRGFPLGSHERAELDDRLADLNRGPLGDALSQALARHRSPVRRVIWLPDGPLHGLPVHALRRDGRYLIEDLEVVWAFSGGLGRPAAAPPPANAGAVPPGGGGDGSAGGAARGGPRRASGGGFVPLAPHLARRRRDPGRLTPLAPASAGGSFRLSRPFRQR